MNQLYIDVHTHRICSDPDICAVVCRPVSDNEEKGFFSWGIHPCFIHTPSRQLQEVEEALQQRRCIALGECGLDKLSSTPMSEQIALFEAQIHLSEQYAKPVIIHCVKAWAELIAEKRKLRPVQSWIIHGFRGKKEMAAQLLREGCYLSFGKYYHEEALLKAWPGFFMLETDEADCSIGECYRRAAMILQVSVGDVQDRIRENCIRSGLFT